MDADRFDALIQSLAIAVPRREALGGAITAGLVALRIHLGAVDTVAKKRRRKKTCQGGKKKCGRTCIPKANCCSDANCGSNETCTGGACLCASGFEDCEGVCIPEDDCCIDDDCPPGATCESGVCDCPVNGQVACGAVCTNLATDAANCGVCGVDCVRDVCHNGACKCEEVDDCPGTGCTCSDRIAGGDACFNGAVSSQTCDADNDCPLGSFCTSLGQCSLPC